jgi:muconate/chloromuconate cycloisomerase
MGNALGRDGLVRAVSTTLIDIPLRRAHGHSRSVTRAQALVLVELLTEGGVVGIGEGVTPGGPWWGGDSAESLKLAIDRHLAPALIGGSVTRPEELLTRMDRAMARNNFAKAALDIAVHDAAARLLGVPLATLFGGPVRDEIPVVWPLGAGDFAADVEEAAAKLASGAHVAFKIKMGAAEPSDDVRRVVRTVEAVGAPCRVDLNQAWDEVRAARYLPELERRGVEIVEAPIPGWNHDGMARLAARLDVPLMADEGLWDHHDAWVAFQRGATDVLAVKVAKAGGLRRAWKSAAMAEAAGIPCYGGMALESSIGTAAALHLLAALPDLSWGSEMVGPLMLAGDLVSEPLDYRQGAVAVPGGPGLGITLDPEAVARHRRPT